MPVEWLTGAEKEGKCEILVIGYKFPIIREINTSGDLTFNMVTTVNNSVLYSRKLQ